MKRALSFILALTLAFALLPTFAFATETETAIDWSQPIVFSFEEKKPETDTTLSATSVHKSDTWQLVLTRSRSSLLVSGGKGKVNADSAGYIQITANETLVADGNNTFVIALKVPASGIYDISADVFRSSAGARTTAVIKNQERAPADEINIGEIENMYKSGDATYGESGRAKKAFSNGVGIPVEKTKTWEAPLANGTDAKGALDSNHIVLAINEGFEGKYSSILYNIIFTPSKISNPQVAIPATEYEIGAEITPTVALNVEGLPEAKTYSDLDMAGIVLGVKEDNVGVTVANNVFTVTKSGEITFTPTVTVNGQTHEAAPVTITVASNEPEEDPDLTNAFNDAKTEDAPSDYIAPTVSSITATGIVGDPERQADGSYKITAPETVDGRGEFLYWKKAMTTNEKIVSLLREFNYVPEEKGRNILVAVYEGDITSDTEKCYNANGQYLPDATPIEDDLPSMAGYGKAYDWKQYKDTNVWVAQYEAETPIAGLNVHITGGNGDNENAAYGDLITCTTSDAHKELYGAYFKYWKRVDTDGTETILSRNEEYSFNAWESCEIEGVYSNVPVNYNGPTRKILIDSFVAGEETGVMAEFLGFGSNVVEKGIMFNGNRIAMTTVGNQFSVIADEAGTYVGYAIVNEDGVLKLITDGSYTKSAN